MTNRNARGYLGGKENAVGPAIKSTPTRWRAGTIVFTVFYLISTFFPFPSHAWASSLVPEKIAPEIFLNADLNPEIRSLLNKHESLGLSATDTAAFERGKDAVAFTSEITPKTTSTDSKTVPGAERYQGPLDAPLKVRTLFDTASPTIKKRILKRQGQNQAAFDVTLETDQTFAQKVYHSKKVGDVQVYEGKDDLITYFQSADKEGNVNLKEWIYARHPNRENGSQYNWKYESPDDSHILSLEKNKDGTVTVYQDMVPGGVDKSDKAKQQHAMDVVQKLFKGKAHVNDHEAIASLQPLIYWTAQNQQKKAVFEITAENRVSIKIQEPREAYPLKIDPALKFGQWLGSEGSSSAIIYAMAVDSGTDEIYVAGTADGVFDESVTFQGDYSGSNEGFILEVADGTNPTLNWGQWLGGTGADEVRAIALNGDEIYAAGYSDSTTSWESVTFQGSHSGSYEGFVVEIADGSTPALNWGQWLGGTGNEFVYALVVTGDEIYVAGDSANSTSWESVTFQGSHSGGTNEGFVVEIADGTTPTLNWGQWLGGDGTDNIYALAVNGDEIYAGGSTTSSTSWESVTFQGTQSGTEGFVIEIADGSSPTLNWGQWLGGTGSDIVEALGIDADEIYAGGLSSSSTSWESVTFQGTQSGNEGFVVEIADGATPTLNWGQWIGGSSTDYVYALAVNGDEIYAGGVSTSSSSWESVTFQGSLASTEGYIVEIADGATPTLNWGQWLGGDLSDYGRAIAVNGDEIYVAGDSLNAANWESVTFQGTNSGREGYVVEIADGGTPALNWGQWAGGGDGADQILALAVNGDEIYVGGTSNGSTQWESVTFQGSHSGSAEAFVVEIADGTTPTLNWGQWLGGTGADYVYALEVNGDEIYAAGDSTSSTSWESVTFQGTHSGGTTEGFVVEIADGSSPTLNWGQWLGGTGADYVMALTVTGDEIYAGGYSISSTSWESVTFQGSHSGGAEGFVVEIADGTTPTLNWGQWLGGTGTDVVNALAVNGDEIYAGGYSGDATSWESVTFQGALSGSEGFVIEIADGSSPTLNWGQWLGGTGTDYVRTLAVNGDEIYAAGDSTSSTSWESVTFQGTHSGGTNEGFVVEIADGTTPTLNWGQWLGGTGADYVYALAVNGDEIYAGGSSDNSSSWESVTFQGSHSGSNEGFVVEIADGSNPSLNWGQWFGGSNNDYGKAVRVTSNEVFAAGYSAGSASWESVTFQGAFLSTSNEGFLVKIADDTKYSGTVYQTNETSPITGSQKTVNIKVNGSGSSTAESASADGTWSIDNLTLADGDTVTIYLNAETEDANTIVVAGGFEDVSGIKLIDDHVIIQAENVTNNVTILDLLDYDNDQNSSDMLFDAEDASPDTLTVEDGNELYIVSGDTFTPGGTVSSGTGGIEVLGTWSVTNSAYTIATTGTLTVNGGAISGASVNIDIDAAAITHTSGSITTTTSGDIYLDGAGAFALSAITSAGLLRIGNTTKPSSITSNGAISGTSTYLKSYGNITINSTVASTGFALYLQADLDYTGGGDVVWGGSGSATLPSNGYLEFYQDSDISYSAITAKITGGNTGGLRIGSNGTITIDQNITGMTGDVTLEAGQDLLINSNISTGAGGYIYLYADTWIDGTGSVNQASSTTLTAGLAVLAYLSGTSNYFADITAGALGMSVNTGSASVVLRNSSSIALTGALTIPANLTFDAGASGTSISMGGAFTNNGTFTGNGSLVTLNGSGSYKDVKMTAGSFNDLTINGSGSWLMSTNVTVGDDFTITQGTLDTSNGATGYDITVNNTNSDGGANGLLINGGTLDASDNDTNLDIAGDVSVSSGTLSAPASTGATAFTIGGDWTRAGTFTHNNGKVTFDKASGTQIINSANTWYGLAVTGSAARTVQFESSVAQTIAANGSLTFTGAASQLLTLAPKTAATAWLLNVNATGVTQSVSYATPTYSDASGGKEIDATNGTNTDGSPGGTNTNWNFGNDTSGTFLAFF